jgi:hypothetical protein
MSLLLTRHGLGNRHILHRRAMVSINSLLRPEVFRRSAHRSYSIKSPSVVLYTIHARSFNMQFPHFRLVQMQKATKVQSFHNNSKIEMPSGIFSLAFFSAHHINYVSTSAKKPYGDWSCIPIGCRRYKYSKMHLNI